MSCRNIKRFFFIIWLIMFLCMLILAEVSHANQIKSEVDRVLVPVTVTNTQGRLVGGLDKGGCGNFRIWEDNIEQEILTCSTEDAPVSVVIVFDRSGSMATKSTISTVALSEFVKTGNNGDEYSLIVFNDTAEQVTDWISPEHIMEALLMSGAAVPKGMTAMLDALYLAIAQAKTAKFSRRIVLLITDGGDNHSRYSEMDIRRAFRESDIQFYGIGMFPCNFKINSQCQFPTQEEQMGPTLLAELSEKTGGLSFMVAPNEQGMIDGKLLSNLAAHISKAIRDQYYLTYRPLHSKAHDAKYHKIKVRVKEPRGSHLGFLIPYTRNGYQASNQ